MRLARFKRFKITPVKREQIAALAGFGIERRPRHIAQFQQYFAGLTHLRPFTSFCLNRAKNKDKPQQKRR